MENYIIKLKTILSGGAEDYVQVVIADAKNFDEKYLGFMALMAFLDNNECVLDDNISFNEVLDLINICPDGTISVDGRGEDSKYWLCKINNFCNESLEHFKKIAYKLSSISFEYADAVLNSFNQKLGDVVLTHDNIVDYILERKLATKKDVA
ncbi:hypothetical protein [Acinetobacter sp. P1(2025)]|uniref:hypothetical protein n=1 Tax=Acinetobacter sp. P1(2025) TaxID=3446120 RepID=UPI003F53B1B6